MKSCRPSRIYKDVTCPFCSLLCDDLTISNDFEKLTVKSHGCATAIRNFERNDPKVSASIHGESVSLDAAIKHAASILRHARHAIFAGSSTDVDGSRELMALAEKTGATIDHVHGEYMKNNALVLQNTGWIMTTLAELKNRADLLIFIGTDASTHYPRFFERFVWNQASLAGLKKNARNIVYIGDKLNTQAGINPDNNKKPTVIRCTKKDINETVSVIRALLKKKKIRAGTVAPGKLAVLKKLTEQMQHARYGVFIWDPAGFPADDGDTGIQSICDLVKDLNRHTRFAGLSLGGNNGGTSLVNVCTWQSGYPLRVSYHRGLPEYDPHTCSSKNILYKKTADAMLWISSFDSSLTVPRADVPTIVLSRPARRPAHDSEVYIPLGTPGIDHGGTLFRTDSIVGLPLKKLREHNLPGGSDVLCRIRQAM